MERESPDFIVSSGSTSYGIEVAQAFRDRTRKGSPSRELESRRRRYLHNLASCYYDQGGEPVYVRASMQAPSGPEIESTVARLTKGRPTKDWDTAALVIQGVTFNLTALPNQAGRYMHWQCVQNTLGWRGTIDGTDIAHTIADKEIKLGEYRNAVQRVQLLVAVDATRNSGMVQWKPGARLERPTKFDAIHIYFHGRDELVRLA